MMRDEFDQAATEALGVPASLPGSDPVADQSAEFPTAVALLPPAILNQPPPLAGRPADIRSWFDGAVLAVIPAHDGTLETAPVVAQAYARHAKADSTRRAYRAGLRDRALLLLGFAGALRRAELAAVEVKHLEPRERGLRLTLPRSKGERTGRVVTVAIPYGRTELCPVRAIRRWQEAAGIVDGALFRRILRPPSVSGGTPPSPGSASPPSTRHRA